MTFVTIRIRKHPTFTNDLLAYGALIVRGARDYKGPRWLSYDFQYRRLAAARQNHGDWGKKDVALWNDTVCKPQDSPSYSAGSEPSQDEGKASKRRAPSQSTEGNKSWSGKTVKELGLLPVQLFRKVYKGQMRFSPHLL